ncbi:hypothetical protein EI94DRAFT_1706487 [Lactarius quietus]|nr:hypothetical protein EI94DRAFT_1706487 [Lactarius quietus]
MPKNWINLRATMSDSPSGLRQRECSQRTLGHSWSGRWHSISPYPNHIFWNQYSPRGGEGHGCEPHSLTELFDKIENFFVRLQTYTEVPPTPAMTNVMGKIMAEVLCMLAIATKVMKQGRTKTFFKNLVGRKDIDGALQRLDKLEQGELRTVTAQVLKTTSDIKGVTSDLRDAASELKDDAKETKVMVQQFVSEMSAHECSYCHDCIMILVQAHTQLQGSGS